MSLTRSCVACGSRRISAFFHQRSLPLTSRLYASKAAALGVNRGEVLLGYCDDCGFIHNLRFEPSRLGQMPPNAEYSMCARNRQHSELAARLVRCYDLRNKAVLQFGTGDDPLIDELCQLGDNRRAGVAGLGQTQTAASPSHDADFISCRHTLAHVSEVQEFVAQIRDSVGQHCHPVLLFEAPDFLQSLRATAFWDVAYEHASYFTTGSLMRLLRSCAFDIFNLASDRHAGLITLEAVASPGNEGPYWEAEEDLRELSHWVAGFADHAAARQKHWRRRLRGGSLGHTVIWSAGARTVAFLNSVDASDCIDYVVDDDPNAHGRFLPGTGHAVVPPEFLRDYRPDSIIVPDDDAREEAGRELSRLGLPADVLAL
jgi:hypothetical protein